MHDVAPRAVSIADAIEAISCTINFAVSFFVMIGFNFKWLVVILVVTLTPLVISSVVERSLRL